MTNEGGGVVVESSVKDGSAEEESDSTPKTAAAAAAAAVNETSAEAIEEAPLNMEPDVVANSSSAAEDNQEQQQQISNTAPPSDSTTPTTPSAATGAAMKTTPRRNPSTDSLKFAGPLPSIEECLFGTKDQERVIAIDGTLLMENPTQEDSLVPLNLLRRVASLGIDDSDDAESNDASLRALAWRVLLGYLPADRREWKAVAAQQRATYQSFVVELFAIDERDWDGSALRGHHAKRRSAKLKPKVKRTKSERERRRKLRLQQKEQQAAGRAPVRFVAEEEQEEDQDHSTSFHNDDDVNEEDVSEEPISESFPSIQAAPSEDTAASVESATPSLTAAEEEAKESEKKAANHQTLEQIMQDPSTWNMSEREQKILDRLTTHHAVNQLLVKRDCLGWNNFLENAKLLDEIRKDVNRTHPHLYFYLEAKRQLGARRYGALERILFVWAKLNKGVRYVQGMNELVGTLYYVLANDFNPAWADHAEADTYILFNIIMSEIRDIFVADMDTAVTGLNGRIENMHNLLGLHDPLVKEYLDQMGIDASFYAVRWLTTLLSREFLLPDTIRLWDSMFASTHKENFLRYVCVTMVLRIRDDLLKGDFATCLQLLQKYPPCSMDDLLDASRALWIYESQITMACVKGGLTLHQSLQAIPPPEKVIMAFGLKGGVALTNREQLAEVSANAKESVKNNVQKAKESMQTLSTAGQGILGGARRFIRGRIQRNRSEGAPTSAESENGDAAPPSPRRVLPFRNVSWGGRAAASPDSSDTAVDASAALPVTPTSLDGRQTDE